VRFRPLLNVEVAVPESASAVAEIPPPNDEVAEPETLSAVVVAPVKVPFVAKRLVAVALVMVAEGANSPPIEERSPEK
jgi:hypothetical protein